MNISISHKSKISVRVQFEHLLERNLVLKSSVGFKGPWENLYQQSRARRMRTIYGILSSFRSAQQLSVEYIWPFNLAFCRERQWIIQDVGIRIFLSRLNFTSGFRLAHRGKWTPWWCVERNISLNNFVLYLDIRTCVSIEASIRPLSAL